MKFKYNGRIYNPVNVEKKLKKMGITMEDIEMIPSIIEDDYVVESSNLYYYYNPTTKCSITSIYNNLNIDGYYKQE